MIHHVSIIVFILYYLYVFEHYIYIIVVVVVIIIIIIIIIIQRKYKQYPTKPKPILKPNNPKTLKGLIGLRPIHQTLNETLKSPKP